MCDHHNPKHILMCSCHILKKHMHQFLRERKNPHQVVKNILLAGDRSRKKGGAIGVVGCHLLLLLNDCH